MVILTLTGGTIWGLQLKLLRTHAIALLGRALKRPNLSLLILETPCTMRYEKKRAVQVVT